MTVRHVVHAIRSDGFAGVERYVCDVGTELDRRGWAVTVVGGDPDRMRRELPSGAHHVRAASTPAVLAALLKVRQVGVLHAHMTAAEIACVLAGAPTRTPVVSTRHFASRRGRSVSGRVAGPVVRRRLARQVAISDFVAASVGEPTTVISNGVRDAAAAPLDTPVVLVLQRLGQEKQTAVAVRAWATSSARLNGWRLRIAGRGPERVALERLVADLGVTDSVTFVGFVDDAGAEMDACSLFLATAPAEPFGLAVVEAMARGLPVVAAGGGAHLETVAAAGSLFLPGDVAACAAALDAVVADAGIRRCMGSAAQDRQRTEFSLVKHVDRIEALYAGLR